MAANGGDPREQSLPDLVKQLAEDGAALLRQEVDLARAEVTEKVTRVRALLPDAAELVRKDVALAGDELRPKGRRVAVGMGAVGVATACGLIGLGLIAAALTAALSARLPVWAAALIAAAVFIAIAGVTLVAGRAQVRMALPLIPNTTLDAARKDVATLGARVREVLPPTPEQTVQTVKDDVAWMRAGMPSDGTAGPNSQSASTAADLRGSAPRGRSDGE
jgi:hypothetical protein